MTRLRRAADGRNGNEPCVFVFCEGSAAKPHERWVVATPTRIGGHWTPGPPPGWAPRGHADAATVEYVTLRGDRVLPPHGVRLPAGASHDEEVEWAEDNLARRWGEPLTRYRWNMACGRCRARLRAGEDLLSTVLDRMAAAEVAEVSLDTLRRALGIAAQAASL